MQARIRVVETNVFVEWFTVIVEKVKDIHSPFYRPAISMEESEGVHPDILTLMKQCWAEEPPGRPSFDEIAKALRAINKGKLALFIIRQCVFLCAASCVINDDDDDDDDDD